MANNEDLVAFCNELAAFARETSEEEIKRLARPYAPKLDVVAMRLQAEVEHLRESNPTAADLLSEFGNLLSEIYLHPGHG